MKCIGPGAKDADLWILTWEELLRASQEGILVDVEHVRAHRSKRRSKKCRSSKSTTEGTEKADELAKEGAMLDGGVMTQTRASAVQQKSEEVSAALQ